MPPVLDLTELLAKAQAMLAHSGRKVLAIAGAPGSGKSTTVKRLFERLEESHPGCSAILPMDGFHYDDAILHGMGRHPWKGAPDTFDADGLAWVLKRLCETRETVAVPVFDRDLEVSRGSARLITPKARLILCEGNYLLLDRPPWDRLAAYFDLEIMIDVAEETLIERLQMRWQGYDLTPAQIIAKLQDNDLPNGRTVRHESRMADYLLKQ